MGGIHAIVCSKQCIKHGGRRVVGQSRDISMTFDIIVSLGIMVLKSDSKIWC